MPYVAGGVGEGGRLNLTRTTPHSREDTDLSMRRLVTARRLAFDPNPRWLACATGLLVLGAACSSALKAPKAAEEDPDAKHLRSGKVTFRNPEMAAMYAAAKANPNAFDPVYVYAKSVTDACLASLIDKRCETCAEGAVRYKRRSELDPQHWAIIEDALSMLEDLGSVPGLPAEQMDLLVATKGRLLWLAGRSVEEQTLIDEYARARPAAVAVIRRRLELLREAGDGTALEAQCARSRAKTQSAPEAARVDLLTACVALHPNNNEGRSDMLDYATYLPNLSPAEDMLYRTSLAQRCLQKVGDEDTRCAQACACESKAGKTPTAKCKRTCGGCRSETAQKTLACQQLGEPPPPPAPAPVRATRSKSTSRPKAAPSGPKTAPLWTPPKTAPAKNVKPGGPKGGAPDSDLQQAVL